MNKKIYDRIWRKNNPDKVRDARNRWKKRNPDKVRDTRNRWKKKYSEHIKKYRRKYNESHRDQIREAARKYNESHRDQIREAARIYRMKYPEKMREAARIYWMKHPEKSNNHRPWKHYPIQELIERDGKKCNECGSEKELSVNHKIPRVVYHDERKIWDVDIKDLNILCRKCNGKHYQETVKKALKHYYNCKLIKSK